MRDVKIKPVLNGWIVNVGCKDVVFDNLEKMLSELRHYIHDPEKLEALYMKDAVNQPTLPEVGELRTPDPDSRVEADASLHAEPEPKLPERETADPA